VRLDSEEPRNAFLSWEDAPGAAGDNILWEIQEDKLYQTDPAFADQRCTQA
jgi:hypothetical protein